MYVISPTQTVFGLETWKFRFSRFGATGWECLELVVRLYANLRADWMCNCRISYNISGSTAICTLSAFQSETIAFTPTKNAPSELTEGAFYQNKQFLQRQNNNDRSCDHCSILIPYIKVHTIKELLWVQTLRKGLLFILPIIDIACITWSLLFRR